MFIGLLIQTGEAMYYPYFRGKQYELITIRENAELIAQNNVVPIIEPVRSSFSGLRRAIEALRDANASFILVVNPQVGDLAEDSEWLEPEDCAGFLDAYVNCSIGFIADADVSQNGVSRLGRYDLPISVIHYGCTRARDLSGLLSPLGSVHEHIFIEESCSRLYRRQFNDHRRILIRDGFIKRKNREHPPREHFSDLHITYPDEGVDGFGDFLIVGDDYSETGGPAYAVAIHLTYVDENEDDDMFMNHYVSDRQLDPTDPGGKFLEALVKLDRDVTAGSIPETSAVAEFIDLHSRQHFPGLGYVKKLSMQHHIETLAAFFG